MPPKTTIASIHIVSMLPLYPPNPACQAYPDGWSRRAIIYAVWDAEACPVAGDGDIPRGRSVTHK